MKIRILSEFYYEILKNMFIYLLESFKYDDTLDIENTETFVEEMYDVFKKIPLS